MHQAYAPAVLYALIKDIKRHTLMEIKEFLNGFVVIHKKQVDNTKVNYQKLLDGYKDVETRFQDNSIKRAKHLLDGFSEARKKRIENQRTTAEDINIFEILGFTDDEVKHSRFLAWLLDTEETHAQGNLFFKYFLKSAELPVKYADVPYKVKTEVKHKESRIDIEIKSEKNFLIHIENKVSASEGDEQLQRETRDLERKIRELEVSSENAHALYLIPQGELPDEAGKFEVLYWRKVVDAVRMFEAEAKAERVRWVAEQYSYSIKKHIMSME